MSKLYKLVVTGIFNAGKTTFVKTLSDIEVVNTDKIVSHADEASVKPTTTVALDYGRLKLNDTNVHLFGTPGQVRFDFMRDILAKGMHGFVFLIDSADATTLHKVAETFTLFKNHANIPYILVANKADIGNLSVVEIRKQLNLAEDVMVVSCNGLDKHSTQAVVEQLVALIEKNEK